MNYYIYNFDSIFVIGSAGNKIETQPHHPKTDKSATEQPSQGKILLPFILIYVSYFKFWELNDLILIFLGDSQLLMWTTTKVTFNFYRLNELIFNFCTYITKVI